LKVFLVPWFKTYSGVALRVYVQGYRCLNDCKAEISTVKGQKVALSLVQAYASSLRLATFELMRFRMAVEADVPDGVADRLLFALSKLGKIPLSRQIPDALVEHPTLENVERFLSIRALAGPEAALKDFATRVAKSAWTQPAST
jgi:hypothetical protein